MAVFESVPTVVNLFNMRIMMYYKLLILNMKDDDKYAILQI